jgi:hypothetical protein
MKNRNTTFTTTILLAVGFLALSAIAQAVAPAPDGGYAGGNTAEGTNALLNLNTATGLYNTAAGFRSLESNVNGRFNTGVGAAALVVNTADQNTATGAAALFTNTSGAFNTADGAFALFKNNTGFSNTPNGDSALFNNTSGDSNTATSFIALVSNTTGVANTAIGRDALSSNITGNNNTAVGRNALLHNSGDLNVAMGVGALNNNNSGAGNTAIGTNTLFDNTTGSANIAIGNSAGAGLTSGSFNVYIGTVAGAPDEVGHTYIANITSTALNGLDVSVDLSTGLLGHSTSSRRYKEDIQPMNNSSEALYQLKPVIFRYKKNIDPKQNLDYGLVAEDVEEVDPRLSVRDGKGRIESVRYNAITAMLLNEFLKEHRKVQELEKRKMALTAQLKEQAAQIRKVSAQVDISKPAQQVVANRP